VNNSADYFLAFAGVTMQFSLRPRQIKKNPIVSQILERLVLGCE
jgi:hypothetical protein